MIHPKPFQETGFLEGNRFGEDRPEELQKPTDRRLSNAPFRSQYPQDPKALERQKYQEAFGDLGYITIRAKLDQARSETDPEKRGNLLVDAQMLMTEYLNMSRDESLPVSIKEKIRDTLKEYLITVKSVAPNYKIFLIYRLMAPLRKVIGVWNPS